MYNRILSPGFIFSITLLLLNDFYLKTHYPSLLTGKLSDFAGLFAFPFFFATAFKRYKKQIYFFTVVLFILWKSPSSANFIAFWNAYLPYKINRVVDYTDLIALLVLPFSYVYKPKCLLVKSKYFEKLSLISISIIAIFSFTATVGIHGNLKRYYLNYSKYEVNQALMLFFKKHLEYNIPLDYEYEVWHYGSINTKDEWIKFMNADSVSFHFYLKRYKLVFWSGFAFEPDSSGNRSLDWYGSSCEFVLVGYLDSLGYWNYDDDLWWFEEDDIVELFEAEIMSKLIPILEANDFKDETYKRHKPLKDDP